MTETQRKTARAAIADANIDTSTLKGQRQAFVIAHEHEVAATQRTTPNGKQHGNRHRDSTKLNSNKRSRARKTKGPK